MEEVDMKDILLERFSTGQGVIYLSPNMTDEMLLIFIKQAISLSGGKPFVVIQAPK